MTTPHQSRQFDNIGVAQVVDMPNLLNFLVQSTGARRWSLTRSIL